MKFILSPARRMKPALESTGTTPRFRAETLRLLERLRAYSPWELESLLKANAKLASEAFFDYQAFDFDQGGGPALLAYDGLVYKNIEPERLSRPALDHAADSLRILSAFYGVLRPFDRIRPYRLEMFTKLACGADSLYEFWGDKLYRALYEASDCVVNLASEEYAQCIRPYLGPGDRFVDVVFLKMVGGKRRVPTTMAKMARGQMARHILENRVSQPEELKAFEWEGFAFREDLSGAARYVFCQEGS